MKICFKLSTKFNLFCFLQNDNTALHYAALSGLKYCVEVSLGANLQLYFKKHSCDLFFLIQFNNYGMNIYRY